MSTATWVPIMDVADGWPTDWAGCYADGFRVVAGYRGPLNSQQEWKRMTDARIAQVRAAGMSIAGMFEGTGTEAVNDPSSGTSHAQHARADWRAGGYSDGDSIAYAVDENVSMTQVKGPIAKYFEAVGKADTALPIAYIENDAAEWLTARGLIVGGFIPAAFSWNDPPELVTPANAAKAAPTALWLQEHNGKKVRGGNVDIGHMRTDAPIWWSGDMAIEQADIDKIAEGVWSKMIGTVPKAEQSDTNPSARWALRTGFIRDGYTANVGLQAVLKLLQANTPEAIAAKLVALLPPGIPGGGESEGVTEAELVADLSRLHLTLDPAAPGGTGS